MNKIKYIKGDLLKSNEKIILHGVNTEGVMGAGIARAIKDMYPFAFNTYREEFEAGNLQLGRFHLARAHGHEGPTIINAVTQTLRSRRECLKPVSYDAIDQIFHDLNNLSTDRIAMPMIGAGLGGGDWNVISAIIERRAENYEPVVYILPGMEIPSEQ